ncbi:HYR-like domain-containing protein, partial [Tenacibaculum agarivorans]|uniref:HYR-like domain-containing protein n=1 Tax=Tenacibaculum agarivorans TaxID=1908389 RepID=UPI000AF64F32
MKTKTTQNLKIPLVLFLCWNNFLNAQVKQQFTPRFSEGIHGNVTMIANNVLSRSATQNYNGQGGNHDFSNVFVDIDSDLTTFNSSSANLTNPEPSMGCLIIKKAYLYWAAADLKEKDPKDELNWEYNKVKLMLPGSAAYKTFTADEVIFRGRDEIRPFVNDPYVCFKDITKEVRELLTPYGKYQVGNVKAKKGRLISHDRVNTGTSGGWQIIFIYENAKLPMKNVSIFDGYANVTRYVNNFEVQFDGFLTVPRGAVNADIVLGALEGDRDLKGDKLQIKDANDNWVNLSYNLRNENNFFNSRISKNGSDFIDRNPASTNTLGFDADIFTLNNTNNIVIKNNQTSATIRLTSNQETYGLFLLGFSVDVWKPDLAPLVLSVNKSLNTPVTVDEELVFSAKVKNNGNDDVNNLKFETNIPEEATLVEPILGLPNGISYTYNTVDRKLTFNAQPGITDVKDLPYTISFTLKVKDQCHFLEESRLADLNMQLIATYDGVLNHNIQITKSSNIVNECGLGDEQPIMLSINKPDETEWITVENALDKTISCDDAQGLINAQLLAPEVSCDLKVEKDAGDFNFSADCSSSGTYVNTWTFTDSYGRVSEVYQQTITIIDTEAPVFVEDLPASELEVSCDAIPIPVILTATDNCDTSVEVRYSEELKNQDTTCSSNYVIERTWEVSDCSGNRINHTQLVKVNDTEAPVFVEDLPASELEVSCDAIPVPVVLTATDNCDTNVEVTYNEAIKNEDATCSSSYIIERTWEVSDCSGNSTSHTQLVKVSDTEAPVFVEDLPASELEVSCDAIPVPVVLTATDNCDTNIEVTYNEEIKNQDATCSSNYVIERTWEVSDCSGNSSSHTQLIKVRDTEAPVFVEDLPVSELEVSCDAIPVPVVLTAMDNCDTNVEVVYSEEIKNEDATCSSNYVIERTWEVSDCSGNN